MGGVADIDTERLDSKLRVSLVLHCVLILGFIPSIFFPARASFSLSVAPSNIFPKALAVTSVLMVFALIANALLDRDFMLLNTGNGSPLVFLLDNGQLFYTLSMIILGFFTIALIFVITVAIKKVKNVN